jgi:hypothetical protein
MLRTILAEQTPMRPPLSKLMIETPLAAPSTTFALMTGPSKANSA